MCRYVVVVTTLSLGLTWVELPIVSVIGLVI